MAIYWEMSISPNIRDLIQKDTYEQIICNLMNESIKIFPKKYERVIDQSNGECDFIEVIEQSNEEYAFNGIESKRKYDAKILFSNIQCQLLARGVTQLEAWVRSTLEEIAEASNRLLHKDWEGIKNTTLHKEMSERLSSVKKDEEAILFIPFHIVPASEHSVYSQFASDILSITYDSIVNESPQKFEDKHTYIIYPSVIDQKVVLRDLTFFRKEYLPIDQLSPYITFALKEYAD